MLECVSDGEADIGYEIVVVVIKIVAVVAKVKFRTYVERQLKRRIREYVFNSRDSGQDSKSAIVFPISGMVVVVVVFPSSGSDSRADIEIKPFVNREYPMESSHEFSGVVMTVLA